MNEFQLAITPLSPQPQQGEFAVEQMSGAAEFPPIERLEAVWDGVVAKLAELAAKAKTTADASPFELASIEFNLGVDLGVSVGLVSKGSAAVTLTFSRKVAGGTSTGSGASS